MSTYLSTYSLLHIYLHNTLLCGDLFALYNTDTNKEDIYLFIVGQCRSNLEQLDIQINYNTQSIHNKLKY